LAYKGQVVVEDSFRLLKSPQVGSVVYLKDPGRIGVLSMLLVFSLLVCAFIVYRLREGLRIFRERNPKGSLRVGWSGRELVSPTFKLLYEHAFNCFFPDVHNPLDVCVVTVFQQVFMLAVVLRICEKAQKLQQSKTTIL
jgi:hypothetical protein